MQDNEDQPAAEEAAAPIDYRTASPEEVQAEQDRLRREPRPQAQYDYSGVDWRDISREDFRTELAKQGIHIRRLH